MNEENEKFIYFLNVGSNRNSNSSEVMQRQVTREEWEASWLSWWNKFNDRRNASDEATE